jgi:hypothetical protein
VDRPVDRIVVGRIATLAGPKGMGWVEAIAISGGRVVAAGDRAAIDALGGPRTRLTELAPNEAAIPGLSDAHLHLADAALAAEKVDLASVATYGDALERIAETHRSLADGDAWVEGLGWDHERWGGWPTAADLQRVAPGRRAAFWAHDHHSYWVSEAALLAAGIDDGTPDPVGGVIRRGSDGVATGILHESAARLVSTRIPPRSVEHLADAIERLAPALVAAGIVGIHDPGSIDPDPGLELGIPAYRRVADADRIRLRVHACIRYESLDRAIELGLRSGDPIGPADGRVRLGWQKLFGDGTLGSRTAAMLAPFEVEPDRPAPPAGPTGLFMTPPEILADHTERAAAAGIASQIHAIGDGAARLALDVLEPTVGRATLMPRLEHVQLVDPADLPRFGRAGIAASVQPVHLATDADSARRGWGERAERFGYPWRTLADAGVVIPFGTDAPVEPWDPWPGLEVAVTRRGRAWPTATAPLGPAEALGIDRALRAICVDPAISAGETDRGRLTPGMRADIVIVPAAALDEPVLPGGPLGTVRPRLVIVDGVDAAGA